MRLYSGVYMDKSKEFFGIEEGDSVYYTFKGLKCGGMNKNNSLYGKTVNLNEMYRNMLEDVRIFINRDIELYYNKVNVNGRQKKVNIISIIKSITYKKYGVTIEKVYRELKGSNIRYLHIDDVYSDLIEVYGINGIEWVKLFNNLSLFYCKNDVIILYIANKILSDKIYDYFIKSLGLKVTEVIREKRKKYGTLCTKVRLQWDGGERYIDISSLIRNKRDWYFNATRNKKLNRGDISEFDKLLNGNNEDEILPDICPVFNNIRMNYTNIDFSNNKLIQKTLKSSSAIVTHQEINSSSYLLISKKILNEHNQFIGILIGVLPLNSVIHSFNNLNIGTHGVLVLRDENLNLVGRFPSIETNHTKLIPSQQLLDLTSRLDSASYEAITPVDNKLRIYSFKKINRYNFFVIAGLSEEDYLISWNKEFIQFSFVYFFFSFICALFSYAIYFLWKKESQKENRLSSILRSSSEGIYGVDDNGICTFCNPKALSLLGYKEESEIVGKPIHSIIRSEEHHV